MHAGMQVKTLILNILVSISERFFSSMHHVTYSPIGAATLECGILETWRNALCHGSLSTDAASDHRVDSLRTLVRCIKTIEFVFNEVQFLFMRF